MVKRFLEKATGLSRAQITRLIAQHRKSGDIRGHRNKPPARPFPRRDTPGDVALLAEVDEATVGRPPAPPPNKILRRMYEVHRNERFQRFASISSGHIYNLRMTRSYRRGRHTFHRTCSTPVRIDQHRNPTPDGRHGHLRVGTAHLGDPESNMGICVINVVDKVTEFQHLGAVPNVTEHFLIPLLEALITAFPFTVEAFNADNGSEYIIHRVAELLNILHIGSSPRGRSTAPSGPPDSLASGRRRGDALEEGRRGEEGQKEEKKRHEEGRPEAGRADLGTAAHRAEERLVEGGEG